MDNNKVATSGEFLLPVSSPVQKLNECLKESKRGADIFSHSPSSKITCSNDSITWAPVNVEHSHLITSLQVLSLLILATRTEPPEHEDTLAYGHM